MNLDNIWYLTVLIENYWSNVISVNTGEPKLALQVKPQHTENNY